MCFGGWRCWLARCTYIQPVTPHNQIYKIQPDTIKVAGNQIQLIAQGQTDGQLIIGYYRCKNQIEQHRWQTESWPLLLIGDIELERIEGATNRHEFDYAQFMGQQKQCFYQTRMADNTIIKQIQPQGWLDTLHHWRQKGLIYLHRLPPALRFHAGALLLGVRETDGKVYQNVLGQLGIIHLLSLSGIHVFYLVTIIRRVATLCRVPREWVNGGLCCLLPIYALFVGGGTSIVRAIGLILLRLVCEMGHLHQSRLDSWSWVLLVNLLWQPYLLLSMGGLLSYLMAFALIYQWRNGTFATTFWLGLLSLPVCLRFNYRWHMLTILINGLIAPIFLPITLGLVIVAILLLPFSYPLVLLGEGFLNNLYQGLAWIAGLPHATVTFGKIQLVPLFLIVVGTLWLMAEPTNKQRVKWIGSSIVSLYMLSFIIIHFNPVGRVIMFDIGQGDSLLIQQPFNRHNLLIDTGGRLSLPQKKWQRRVITSRAEKVTINYLYSCGIDHLDAIALSHQDADHIGDLGQIMQRIRVKRLICAAGLPQNQQFKRQVRPYLKTVIIEPYLAGQHFTVGQQQINVLAPVIAGTGTNADSLVLQAQIGDASWLFTGDLERVGEIDITHRYPQLRVDYLKVGHHGSQTASAPQAIAAWHVKGALISAGRHNRYGHPHPQTIQTLQQANVPFWNTAECGMLEWQYGWGLRTTIKTTLKDCD
ncbi:DNA internalization-related competence protein ComEC Rec2 [Latilactobacillus graminis DSM 20719]|uniref:DNA internalization-related competence protein ComEC Rec2 n=2 Tax=Latilactobacillus graminis TaxID=60519 RepID=A0AA89I355_9LACO|nr:DNA internalization-related competence protein ComEC Rec2 [Latilactobacillus graminis DSM 20719]